MKRIITAAAAPDAIGPYSHGTAYGDLIFTSGQLPVCKQQGGVVEGGIAAQTRQSLENLKSVLEAAG
ncbi:MAG: Rid family hydrolase, partial [Aeromonas veronii]